MKRLRSLLIVAMVLVGSCFPLTAHAAFNKDILIDDVVFNDTSSMTGPQIDAFLNSRNSCISSNSGFSAVNPVGYSPSSGYQYGGHVSAGTVISNVSQVYGLNPQVLLVTLQKEQSLITSTSCSTDTIAKAVGYACPDNITASNYSGIDIYSRNGTTYTSVNGTCVNSAGSVGFSQQLIHAAWLLKFSQQRSLGNTSWAVIYGNWDNSDDLVPCYSGLMTQGTLKRCPNGSATYYDGWATIDGVATHMESGATAALYRYTPHFHGNQNFVNIFESWFGGTISALFYSCHNATNVAGVGNGAKVVSNHSGRADNMTLTLLNNTASACIEAHTWLPGQQSWYSNIATSHPAVDPRDDTVISADTNGDGISELYIIKYRGGDSGKIEIHGWDPSAQHWTLHVATNHPAVDPANNVILAMNTGDGKDKFVLVKLRGGDSGKIEVHTWLPGEQGWYSNIATNHPAVDPANNTVVAADQNGDGIDELSLIKYRGGDSGRIEVHTWLPGLQGWYSNIATNHPAVDPANYQVVPADENGDRKDEFHLVIFRNTGSGKIEIHTWLPGLQGWYSNIATNLPSL